MRDLMNLLAQNALIIILLIVVALAFLALVVFLILRSRGGQEQRDIAVRNELVAMEHEEQFTVAARQVPVMKAPSEVASRIADLFGEFLWSRVLAVYAGQPGADTAADLLPELALQGSEFAGRIPRSIPQSRLEGFSSPRVARLADLTAGSSARTQLVPPAPPVEQPPPEENSSQAPAAEDDEFRTGPLSESPTSTPTSTPTLMYSSTPAPVPSPETDAEAVLVLPWSGPFRWSGVIVARTKGKEDEESLSQYREPLVTLGERLAIALELESTDSRLSGSTERAVQFSRGVLLSLDEASPVASLIREVSALLGSDSAALWRIDEATGMVSMVASHGLRSAEFLPLPVGQGLAGSVIQSRELLALEDAPSDERCIFPREARESGIASYLGAPLESDGKIIGVLEVHSSQHRRWSDSDLRMLESAAAVASQLLKSADARGNRLRVESAYLGLSEALQRLRSADDLMEAAVEVLGHALGVSRAIVVELDEKGQTEPIRHEFRATDVGSASGATLAGSLASEVVTADDGKAIAITDSTERSLLAPAVARQLQVESELAVGVRLNGIVRGIIYLHQCDRRRDWQEDEREFVERVARQLALSLASVRSFDAVASEAQLAKDASRQATEAGARVQSLINSLPESVLVLDSEGRLNYFNATARDRFGLANEDVGRHAHAKDSLNSTDGRIWEQVTACQNAARFEAEFSRAAVGSSGAQAVATAPQTRSRFSVSVAPFRSGQGGPVVGRIVVLTDVGHVQVEGASSEVGKQLAAVQQRLSAAEAAVDQARAALAAAHAAEAFARGEADKARHGEARARAEVEGARQAAVQARGEAESARRVVTEARGEGESARQAVAQARGEAEAARNSEARALSERDNLREEVNRAQAAGAQLLETNRLKSDFIVSAGHEIEASLQPVLGITELLGQGQYGPLTPEQQEAIRNIYAWARRIKGDVDWLIEYGSARSRRLETAGGGSEQ
jgi:GAF domain-containing protein/DNA-binding FrmR family transcriptional regulator